MLSVYLASHFSSCCFCCSSLSARSVFLCSSSASLCFMLHSSAESCSSSFIRSSRFRPASRMRLLYSCFIFHDAKKPGFAVCFRTSKYCSSLFCFSRRRLASASNRDCSSFCSFSHTSRCACSSLSDCATLCKFRVRMSSSSLRAAAFFSQYVLNPSIFRASSATIDRVSSTFRYSSRKSL